MIEKYRKVLGNVVSNIGLLWFLLALVNSPTYMSQTTSHHICISPSNVSLVAKQSKYALSSFQALVLGQWAANAVEHYKQSKYSKMPSTAHFQESDKQFKCTTSKSLFQKHWKQYRYSKMTHFQENTLRLNFFFKQCKYSNVPSHSREKCKLCNYTVNQRPVFVYKRINQQWQCWR